MTRIHTIQDSAIPTAPTSYWLIPLLTFLHLQEQIIVDIDFSIFYLNVLYLNSPPWCFTNMGEASVAQPSQTHVLISTTYPHPPSSLFKLPAFSAVLSLMYKNTPHPICHEIPHLLDPQNGRLCLFFIWTERDEARCLAAARCSGVTAPVTGHDERAQMKDEAWRILGRGAPHGLLPLEYPRRSGRGKLSL